MWRASVALTILTALLAPAAATQAQTGAQPQGAFSDDDGSVHEPALNELAGKGYLAGTECAHNRICPSRALQRWELAVWLGRAITGNVEPAAVSRTRFADVDPEQWWAAHVERLAELEVTTGCRAYPFHYCPDEAVTRARMATFLVRAFKLPPGPPAGFNDTADTFHAANIDALAAAGLTRGCRTSPLSYCPHAPVTRAQMATFIARAIGLLAPATITVAPDTDQITAAEAETAALVNQLRLSLGLDALVYHEDLAAVARGWSETMAATRRFKHNPDYSRQYPPGWSYAAENIATVSGDGSLERHVHVSFDLLVDSRGHYKNMTNPNLTHIGVGVAVSGGRYGNNYWVTQNFARYP